MTEEIWPVKLPAPFNIKFDLKGPNPEDLQKIGNLRTNEKPYEPQCNQNRCRIYLGDEADDSIALVQDRNTSYSPVYIRFEIVDTDPSNPQAIQKMLMRQKGHTKADIKTEANAQGITLSRVTFLYTGGTSYAYTLIHCQPAILISNDFSLVKNRAQYGMLKRST